jgi:hypothetical protein
VPLSELPPLDPPVLKPLLDATPEALPELEAPLLAPPLLLPEPLLLLPEPLLLVPAPVELCPPLELPLEDEPPEDDAPAPVELLSPLELDTEPSAPCDPPSLGLLSSDCLHEKDSDAPATRRPTKPLRTLLGLDTSISSVSAARGAQGSEQAGRSDSAKARHGARTDP